MGVDCSTLTSSPEDSSTLSLVGSMEIYTQRERGNARKKDTVEPPNKGQFEDIKKAKQVIPYGGVVLFSEVLYLSIVQSLLMHCPLFGGSLTIFFSNS